MILSNWLFALRKSITIPFAYKVISKRTRSVAAKVLDIGCGEYMPRYVRENISQLDYWGVDIQDTCINSFTEKHKFKKIDIVNAPLPFDDNSFDVVIMSHVLEHLPTYHHILQECYRVLRPNGILYLETPSPRMLFLPSMEGTLNFFDDLTHIRPFTRRSLINLLRQADFTIMKCATRRDWLWIWGGLPFVILKRFFKNQPLYGGYFWDLFGCVVYGVGTKPGITSAEPGSAG